MEYVVDGKRIRVQKEVPNTSPQPPKRKESLLTNPPNSFIGDPYVQTQQLLQENRQAHPQQSYPLGKRAQGSRGTAEVFSEYAEKCLKQTNSQANFLSPQKRADTSEHPVRQHTEQRL